MDERTRLFRSLRIGESAKRNYQWLDQAPQMLQGLNEQRNDSHFCDIILVANDQRILAHRAVLAVSSPYFDAMFSLELKEKHQKEVWKVVDYCCEYLEQAVSDDNYLCMQELALLYNLERLEAFVDSYVLARFSVLSVTPRFHRDMPLHKLNFYLSRDEVTYHSEQALLQTCMQWIVQNPEQLSGVKRLLSLIRFPLMPAEELVNQVLPALRALLPKEVGYEELVDEALTYHYRLSAQPLLQSTRTTLRGGVERLLLVGGQVSDGSEELSSSLCRLDNEAGIWDIETVLPSQKTHHSLAVLGGFVFAAGGSCLSRNSSEVSACDLLFRYDPRNNQWIQGASMNECRVDFYLGTVGEFLIAVGGRNDSGTLSSVELYNPAEDCWSYTAELPRHTYGHAGVLHNGVVYISGGHEYQVGPYRRDVLSYDPSKASSTWEMHQPMSLRRGWHCMASLHHLIYIIGGSDDDEHSAERFDIKDVESYNPCSGQWTQVTPLMNPNNEAGVAVWAGKIYVLGGYSWEASAFSRDTQVFDPNDGVWVRGPDLPKCTAGASACVCLVKPSPYIK
ncbi:kelch-like protein 36 isoform 2-T3 [Pholidichthys leucotaenia]